MTIPGRPEWKRAELMADSQQLFLLWLIYRRLVSNVTELATQFDGFDSDLLQELQDDCWISVNDGQFQLTPNGKQIIDDFVSQLTTVNVLLVDDEAENLRSLVRALKRRNERWNIETAHDTKEAQTLLHQQRKAGRRFDLLLTDLVMESTRSGLEILADALKINSSIVAVLFTANEQVLDRDAALSAGFWAVVEKNSPNHDPVEQIYVHAMQGLSQSR